MELRGGDFYHIFPLPYRRLIKDEEEGLTTSQYSHLHLAWAKKELQIYLEVFQHTSDTN